MDKEKREKILEALYEELLKRPPNLRGGIIKQILFLELGYPGVESDVEVENRSHPHWDCGDK